MASYRQIILTLVGILIVTTLAFLPSLDNSFTNGDDPTFVLDNEVISIQPFCARAYNNRGILYTMLTEMAKSQEIFQYNE